MRMVENSLKAYDYEIDEETKNHFKEFRKTHNQGVFDAYTPEIRAARHTGLITGLPDAYGRGRIIGDYRRVALHGTDLLIKFKEEDLLALKGPMTPELIQLREEVSEQIRALKKMEKMALSYDYDISKPATTAQEALQHIYFAYLAGAKENNGAATSLGRVSTFVDMYMERDLEAGHITEMEAQELVDQFILKLRLIRHLRTPSYDELFAGDPTWVTESIGGMGIDGRSLVTKTSYRFLQSLYNLGPAPEPNLTILWDNRLPENFKKFCAQVSIDTNAIQYENDSLMREIHGDDYGIACCVSAMSLGKEMQFFGARCNLAKALLYAINGGRDEFTGALVVPNIPTLKDEQLDFFQVWENLKKVIDYVADLYVQANNIIHYMHDKYAYEASQMALHDTDVKRLMAFGIAGFSVAVDSLSAINFARVYPIRDDNDLAVDFRIDGNFPKYGNDDDRVDSIGKSLVKTFARALRKYPTYRNAKHTLSILTITSNVVYGKKTGSTPDGRLAKEPFAPGANPMHGRDSSGPLASLNSVAKLPYDYCEDGISNTFSIVPHSLGHDINEQVNNLVHILDGYFKINGHHLNVNVLNRETLEDAIEHPEEYPALTIRVSGYAVLFNSLTKEQKLEVLKRTFHE
jgi:formate C-acetyltransferase